MQSNPVKQTKVLNEIVGNAIGLPLESQNLLLMMAKAMQYTRDCVIKQKRSGENK